MHAFSANKHCIYIQKLSFPVAMEKVWASSLHRLSSSSKNTDTKIQFVIL